MKKLLLTSAVVLLSACSANQTMCPCMNDCPYMSEEIPVMVEGGCGCSQQNVEVLPEVLEELPEFVDIDPCKCAYSPDKTREVLRPRIKEVVKQKTRRDCPKDQQSLNCGCGECKTFDQTQENTDNNEVTEIIPEMPEAYELAASRVFNRFVKETTEIYGAKPNVLLYVKNADVKSEDLPKGVEKGIQFFKDKVLKSYTYAVTTDENNHDCYVETSVDWFDTPSKTVPAIKYTATLFDKDNKQLGQWTEIVKKAENSKTWL